MWGGGEHAYAVHISEGRENRPEDVLNDAQRPPPLAQLCRPSPPQTASTRSALPARASRRGSLSPLPLRPSLLAQLPSRRRRVPGTLRPFRPRERRQPPAPTPALRPTSPACRCVPPAQQRGGRRKQGCCRVCGLRTSANRIVRIVYRTIIIHGSRRTSYIEP